MKESIIHKLRRMGGVEGWVEVDKGRGTSVIVSTIKINFKKYEWEGEKLKFNDVDLGEKIMGVK